MTPNFALDFRADQIKILHLQDGLWVQIGTVAVDDPDLDAALGYLRSTALGLSPRGLASKLILPDAAILYTTVGDLSSDTNTRAAQIASALVGRTPYAVEDLVYDWTDDGPRAHLAVIARETLDEAEAFAVQHRFNPVAFAAWPEQGQFQGEADFGSSATALDFAAPVIAAQTPALALSAKDFEMGETGGTEQPLSTPVDFAAEIDEAGENAPSSAEPSTIAEMSQDPQEQVAEFLLHPFQVKPKADATEKAEDFVADSGGMATLDTGPDQTKIDQETADSERSEPVLPEGALVVDAPADVALADPDMAVANAPEINLPDIDPPDIHQPDIDPLDMDPPAQLSGAQPASAPIVQQPDLFAPAPDPSFAEVMAKEADEAPMALDVPIDDTVDDEPAQGTAASAGPSAGKAQTLLAEFASRREAALGKAETSGQVEPLRAAAKDAAPVMTAKTAPTSMRADLPRAILAAPKPARMPDTSLGNKPSVKRPAPKGRSNNSALMGFILTILLLIALAAAAAMSSYLTAAWNSYGATSNLALVQPLDQPTIEDEMAADLPHDDIMQPSSPAPQTSDVSTPLALPNPIALPAPTMMLSSENAANLVPLTTPAALPQPLVIAPPDILTASAQIAQDAPLITPTPQGVVTPDGVFLIAGRPSLVPNPRPDAIVAAAVQRPAVAALGPLDADNLPFADPALADKRPAIRPDGLAPQIASDPALAGKLPLARPEAVLDAANAAQIASASLADVNAPRSPYAVTISRLPVPRPNNLNTTIEAPQAVAAAPEIAAPEVAAPEVAAGNVPIEADNEPEVVAAKSSGPRTVVSRNATFKNAINLSKVNLIGVYGSQANRYALIRQSNGRFKKVYVGDRFDGGLVAAITENELRYSKGGQMLALQMPKG